MTNFDREEAKLAREIDFRQKVQKLVDDGVLSSDIARGVLERFYEALESEEVIGYHKASLDDAIMEDVTFIIREENSVSLTEIAAKERSASSSYIIQSWMRDRKVIGFLYLWERKNNPDFDEGGYGELKEMMKQPSFTLTPKRWIEKTKAVGLTSKQGKNGGTFAHPMIACEFTLWLKPECMLKMVERFAKISSNTD